MLEMKNSPLYRTPKLTLVGAGPGDVDLITVKGVKALQEAQVVLYDALVHPALLDYAPQAEHIFVGKRKGAKIMSQDAINQLIVKSAFEKGSVVRLKGGDSHVFGRGGEEMIYAAQFGIQVANVPGISSAIGVPAQQDIPVTKRGVSEGFWVVTGTTKNGQLSSDVALAAQSNSTVVILMGMSKLSEIVDCFALEGKEQTPVAVIQNGTRGNEKIGLGTIDSIEEVVFEKGLENPAIIIIGEVVNHRQELRHLQYEYQHLHRDHGA
ncbi:uroporphyrinogen-III C-methyltransferase [Sediminicola luteus]|uniref:uroporphyrinogen-III C-methyltransferase n=2 Tax=Sediminicola luteus TaxID=319238 RepID=A0A2A4G4G6_9FLAO|nr:uroporphyrinogen-III C-methyltransferase [Sediminicola luteus]